MKLTKLFPIAFLFFGFITSKSFSSTDTVLIMTGYGATEKEATQSAIQNAIETSKGILLLSTSNITNNQLKSDGITISPEGYSYKHRKISSIKSPDFAGIFSFEVTDSVWVSIDPSRTLSTSNMRMDSMIVYLESMKTKEDRIKRAKDYIKKWIEAHDDEYGYKTTMRESRDCGYDGYTDITFTPFMTKSFEVNITKLIDRLNSFSHTNHILSFRYFAEVPYVSESVQFSSERDNSSCGVKMKSKVKYNNMIAETFQEKIAYNANERPIIAYPLITVDLLGAYYKNERIHDKRF